MQRRNFLQQTLTAGAGVLVSSHLTAQSVGKKSSLNTPFKLNYAFHEGMFKNLAGNDFIDQIKYGHSIGFRAIEDNGMMDRPVEQQKKIGDTLAALGMQMGVFVLSFDHWPLQTSLTSGKAEWKEKFLKYCKDAIDVAKRCNAKLMTVVPGNYDRSIPDDYQLVNVLDALKRGAEILEPHGLTMVLEPLSDTPDLFLRHSSQGYALCKAVNSPACKMLFDMYHMQRNEGNIINNVDSAWDEIAYFQIGDNPGRKEPTTGEMNYKNIFQHIYKKGYKGILGMEHGILNAGKEGEQALITAYRLCDDFSIS